MEQEIIGAFRQALLHRCAFSQPWEPTGEQLEALRNLSAFATSNGYNLRTETEQILIEAINQKLALNGSVYKRLLDTANLEKIKLNYLQKAKIRFFLDSSDRAAYLDFLGEHCTPAMENAFAPVSTETTFRALGGLISSDPQYREVLSSIFSRFCFHLFPEECVRRFFSGSIDAPADFFGFIHEKYPDMGDRKTALTVIDVSAELFRDGYEEGANRVLNAVRNSYKELCNHCDMAIVIPPIFFGAEDLQWRLYADCILYAEKHIKEKIDKPYFRWQKIGAQTTEYIPQIVPFHAEFEYAFQGFVFKDCFVVQKEKEGYSLMLIFEKNRRDERVVNCPACRTANVQGNSYPILNVKSWECRNPLCPDRSKYNRGKRYAYMSLFRQKEMMNDDNIIPEASISKWRLDCRPYATREQMFEMLIRHYSCFGDGVCFVSRDTFEGNFFDRTVRTVPFSPPKTNLLRDFKDTSYFYRYIQYDDSEGKIRGKWSHGGAEVICGDALYALRGMEDEKFAGAVTSPPYYNAKSYSQWQNIYCYLYDMYNIGLEIFRTMKSGGVFLFNIFDYFDNENNVVTSAMGNKRMILGAYLLDLFQRIGFTVRGNIIWNKGEIQGNRSFNQGNLTPYYQAPLNCWEHVLILSKGEPNRKFGKLFSRIETIKPVIKIVKGRNVLGHEAPFPHEIPDLLLDCMTGDDVVLDPFLGSGTTCIAANNRGVRSVGIEVVPKYYELCKSLISQ